MSGKRKQAKKPKPSQIPAEGKPDEDEGVVIARTVLRPTVQAAVTLKEYGKAYGDLDLPGLIDALTVQTKAASDGDLGRGEAMLATQAHILDAIFNNLARRAINAEYMDNFDRYLKLALRAQSQCRATWETLSAMKNPPMVGYVDKLDGTIDAAFYEKMAAEWRGEQERCLRDIERHQGADQSYLDEGVRLIELAQNAQRLFEKQDSREKRRLLDFLVSNCSWADGELSVTLKQPFDLIAETAMLDAQKKAAGDVSNDLSVNWLPGPDSNQRPTG